MEAVQMGLQCGTVLQMVIVVFVRVKGELVTSQHQSFCLWLL